MSYDKVENVIIDKRVGLSYVYCTSRFAVGFRIVKLVFLISIYEQFKNKALSHFKHPEKSVLPGIVAADFSITESKKTDGVSVKLKNSKSSKNSTRD